MFQLKHISTCSVTLLLAFVYLVFCIGIVDCWTVPKKFTLPVYRGQPDLNTCWSFSETPIYSVSFIRQIQTGKLWVCLLECFSHLSNLFVNQTRVLSLYVCFCVQPTTTLFCSFYLITFILEYKLTFTTWVMIYFAEKMLYRKHWHFIMCYLHFFLLFLRFRYENWDFRILQFHTNVLKEDAMLYLYWYTTVFFFNKAL